jgi:hypothetical protein
MNSPVSRLSLPLLLAATLVSGGFVEAAETPVLLDTENVATSVWDTDPTKVGVVVQIGNSGSSAADNVVVTSVVVQEGAFSGPNPLPVALGTIKPNGSALLDLIITVPRTDGAQYLLTISGTYAYAGELRPFSLTGTVTPDSAAPGPFMGESDVSTKRSGEHSPPVSNPPAAAPPPFGPNATTPMMIPVGPPRQLSLPNQRGTDSTINNQ